MQNDPDQHQNLSSMGLTGTGIPYHVYVRKPR